MTSIVRQCPFYDHPTQVRVGGEEIDVLSYQIILWVGLRTDGILLRTFPAILDTGNSFGFSMKEEQLEAWAGVRADSLPRAGTIELNKRKHVVRVADLAIFRNARGDRDALRGPFDLKLPRGVAVYAKNDPAAPRLPLLGLRTLMHNRLTTKIDGRPDEAFDLPALA